MGKRVSIAYPDYSPVCPFHFLTADENPNAGLTVRVGACTGNVDTGTNQRGFPSPYRFYLIV